MSILFTSLNKSTNLTDKFTEEKIFCLKMRTNLLMTEVLLKVFLLKKGFNLRITSINFSMQAYIFLFIDSRKLFVELRASASETDCK